MKLQRLQALGKENVVLLKALLPLLKLPLKRVWYGRSGECSLECEKLAVVLV